MLKHQQFNLTEVSQPNNNNESNNNNNNKDKNNNNNNKIDDASSSSEDQFSFFPSSESFNDDIDKGFFERDDFDRGFFDNENPDKLFSKLEDTFGDFNRRQDSDDETDFPGKLLSFESSNVLAQGWATLRAPRSTLETSLISAGHYIYF